MFLAPQARQRPPSLPFFPLVREVACGAALGHIPLAVRRVPRELREAAKRPRLHFALLLGPGQGHSLKAEAECRKQEAP